MIKKASSILLIIPLILLYNNCSPSFQSSGEEYGLYSDVNVLSKRNKLGENVKGILNKNCASCHNSNLNFAGIDDITNLDKLKSSGLINVVIKSIESGRMPPSGRKLNVVERTLIKNWNEGKTSYVFNETQQCKEVAFQNKEPEKNKLWLINRKEYKNMINDVFGLKENTITSLPEPFVSHGFVKNSESISMDGLVFHTFTEVAEGLAEKLTSNKEAIEKYLPCQNFTSSSLSNECLNDFISIKLGQLFRKKMTTDEIDKYRKIFELAKEDTNPAFNGLKNVIFASLINPNFLYKKEIRDDDLILKNYYIAEDLAFHIYRSVPDAELLDLANKGDLVNENIRGEQIRRMLGTEKGKTFFKEFIADYFDIDIVDKLTPADGVEGPLKTQYLSEFNQFVDGIFSNDQSIHSLFTKNSGQVTRGLASVAYGIETSSSDPLKIENLGNQSDRAGILTLPAFLLASSTLVRNVPSHITRGAFVREKLLCHELGSPPDVGEEEEIEEILKQNKSPREIFTFTHLTKKDCKSCHELIDPIGFGMDYFDDFGKIMKVGNTSDTKVDTSGYVSYTNNSNFEFSDAADLSRKLASSKDVSDCFVERTYEYLKGDVFHDNNLCSIEKLQSEFRSSDGNILELVVSILNEPYRFKSE